MNQSVKFLKNIQAFLGKKYVKSDMKTAICETMANMLSPLAAHEYKEGRRFQS